MGRHGHSPIILWGSIGHWACADPRKDIFFASQDSLFLHLRQLVRERTPFDAQILSELLAIIGNFEGARFLGTHGIRQIRHDSPSNRLGRRMHRALYEVEVTTRTYF